MSNKVTISGELPCPYCGENDPQGLDRTKCAMCKRVFAPGDEQRAAKFPTNPTCPYCGARAMPTSMEGTWACSSMHRFRLEAGASPPPVAPRPPPPGTKVYKVLTQRDEFFQSKFNPANLQTLINLHAAEGWRVVNMTATDVGSFWGSFWAKGGGASRQELIVLLERTVE